jgi:hypothetical protein
LWQEIRDPACKTAINWVTNVIRRMTRRRALEQWETKIANTDIIPLAIWPIAKFLMKRDGLQFMCDENHKRQVEARFQALLEAVENNPP